MSMHPPLNYVPVFDDLSVFYSFNEGFAFLIALTRTEADAQRYTSAFEEHSTVHVVQMNDAGAWEKFIHSLGDQDMSGATVLLDMTQLDEAKRRHYQALLNRARTPLEKKLNCPLCMLVSEASAPEIVTYLPDMFSIRQETFYPNF